MSNTITDDEIIMLMNEMSIESETILMLDDYEPTQDEIDEINLIETDKSNIITVASK